MAVVTQPALHSATTNLSQAKPEVKPRLKLTSLPRTIHGDIQIYTIVVMAESNKFSFLPPRGWQVESDAPQKRIQLVRTENGARILVEIVEANSGAIAEPTAQALLDKVHRRFSNASAIEELRVSALGQSGSAFDLEWRTAGGVRRKARIGFISFAGGSLECVLTSSPASMSQDCQSLNQLLLSLRCAPLDGKLDLPNVTPE